MITVKDNTKEYSSLDCTRARKIRELQHILACPANEDLVNAIKNNVIGNNSFGRKDIHIANKVFGPSMPSLKGKMVQRKSKLQREDEPISVPPTIVEQFKHGVTLSIDVMHVNKIAFLVSKAYHLAYYQCIPIRHKTKGRLLEAILTM